MGSNGGLSRQRVDALLALQHVWFLSYLQRNGGVAAAGAAAKLHSEPRPAHPPTHLAAHPSSFPALPQAAFLKQRVVELEGKAQEAAVVPSLRQELGKAGAEIRRLQGCERQLQVCALLGARIVQGRVGGWLAVCDSSEIKADPEHCVFGHGHTPAAVLTGSRALHMHTAPRNCLSLATLLQEEAKALQRQLGEAEGSRQAAQQEAAAKQKRLDEQAAAASAAEAKLRGEVEQLQVRRLCTNPRRAAAGNRVLGVLALPQLQRCLQLCLIAFPVCQWGCSPLLVGASRAACGWPGDALRACPLACAQQAARRPQAEVERLSGLWKAAESLAAERGSAATVAQQERAAAEQQREAAERRLQKEHAAELDKLRQAQEQQVGRQGHAG